MSWGTCYSSCNNICESYPTLMSDSRAYTNYNPACRINNEYMKANGINTTFNYRRFLTQNATQIMGDNRTSACNQVGICKFGPSLEVQPTNKYLYKSCQDMTQPYGYENSDLKNLYLSREALQTRMSAPLMSQQSFLQYPKPN